MSTVRSIYRPVHIMGHDATCEAVKASAKPAMVLGTSELRLIRKLSKLAPPLSRESITSGKEINKAAIVAGDGLVHFGKEINKEAIIVGDGINHFGKEFEKEFCNVMTLGAYKRGEASCGVNAGVGKDNQGYYTYNPQTPDTHYRGNEGVRPNPFQRHKNSRTWQRHLTIRRLNTTSTISATHLGLADFCRRSISSEPLGPRRPVQYPHLLDLV